MKGKFLEILKPYALKDGDKIGVITPSSPGYCLNPGLFENGLRVLKSLGYETKLGRLTAKRASQGYRSGDPEERASEFMDFIHDDEIRGVITTIGGANSSSMIPFLDFNAIRQSRKVFCGYSDITSLHLAILHYSRLSTFYGPGVMTWFGDWPDGLPEANQSFLDAFADADTKVRRFTPPSRWSNHMRDWKTDDWKSLPREFQANEGWKVLGEGEAEAPLLAANLNTLVSAAGTPYFPDLKGRILLIEEMNAPLSEEERSLRQLQLMGVFDQISALIVSKPEFYDKEGAPFGYDHLVMEVVGDRDYPIESNFDCGHTVPMFTLASEIPVSLKAESGTSVSFEVLEPMVVSSKIPQ